MIQTLTLGRLEVKQRKAVFSKFGPGPNMQLYQRGIRRRLAPMLQGDRRRLELAYSLMMTLPGTPVIRYGDEIGMGDNLALPERNCARTPMQWSTEPQAGFTKSDHPALPVISDEYTTVFNMSTSLISAGIRTHFSTGWNALSACAKKFRRLDGVTFLFFQQVLQRSW